MTTLIEMEGRLRAARPNVETPAPPLPSVLARIADGTEPAEQRSARRNWRKAPVAIPVLVGALLLATGGVAAALLLSSGEPVQPAFVLPATPNVGLGEPLPASLSVLPMRVADPEGGAPWGMRVIRTTRGLLCLQAGRVVQGQLGGLGTGYAFGADNRFHPFMAEDAISTDACPAVGASAGAFLPGPPVIVPANALPLAGENVIDADKAHCDLPGQEDWGVRCPQQELRQVAYGLLGPNAKSIAITTPQHSYTVQPYGALGAYLIVVPAQPQANVSMSSGGYDGPFGYTSHAPGGVVLTVTYDDGATCQIPFTGAAQQCRAHDSEPQAAPIASELATPVEATYVPVERHPVAALLTQEASGATFKAATTPSANPSPGPALEVSFRAPVAVNDAASAYAVELRPRPVAGCATPAVIVSQPTQQTLAKASQVQIATPLETSCATRYTGRVFFATSSRIGGDGGGEGPLYETIAAHFGPGSANNRTTLPTVGRFEVAVP